MPRSDNPNKFFPRADHVLKGVIIKPKTTCALYGNIKAKLKFARENAEK